MARSKYKKDFPQRAMEYAQTGLNDEQIAKKLGISLTSFYSYQEKYPEFLKAIKRGKTSPDIEVENALFKRATGFTKTVNRTKILNDGTKVFYTDEVYYPPDPTCGIFWSCNRQPDRWRSINSDHKDDKRPQTVGFEFKVVSSLEDANKGNKKR